MTSKAETRLRTETVAKISLPVVGDSVDFPGVDGVSEVRE